MSEDTNKDLNHAEKTSNQKSQFLIVLMAFIFVIVMYRPIFYTYFINKAEKTNDVNQKVLYAKKALRFSSIEAGKEVYSKALINYIGATAQNSPNDIITILSREKSNIPSDDLLNEAYSKLYEGMGEKMQDTDKDNALYSYILAGAYNQKTVSNNPTYKELINSVIIPKLNSGEKIIKYASGDINNDGLAELALVVGNGTENRIVIFDYSGNRFKLTYSINIQSQKISYISYGSIGSNKNAFFIIDDLQGKKQEINVLSYVSGKYQNLYKSTSDYGFVVSDVDKDKNYEIGINSAYTSKNEDYKITWLKYENAYYEYFATVGNKEIYQQNSSVLLY